MTSRWILPLLVATAIPALARAQDLGAARAFVAGLYDGRAETRDPLGEAAPRIFASPLLAAIRKDQHDAQGEVGALDGDPICDCQDDGGMTVSKLAVSPVDARRARADVTLRWPANETRRVRFDLVVTSAGWRIADVHTAETPSLLDLLKGR